MTGGAGDGGAAVPGAARAAPERALEAEKVIPAARRRPCLPAASRAPAPAAFSAAEVRGAPGAGARPSPPALAGRGGGLARLDGQGDAGLPARGGVLARGARRRRGQPCPPPRPRQPGLAPPAPARGPPRPRRRGRLPFPFRLRSLPARRLPARRLPARRLPAGPGPARGRGRLGGGRPERGRAAGLPAGHLRLDAAPPPRTRAPAPAPCPLPAVAPLPAGRAGGRPRGAASARRRVRPAPPPGACRPPGPRAMPRPRASRPPEPGTGTACRRGAPTSSPPASPGSPPAPGSLRDEQPAARPGSAAPWRGREGFRPAMPARAAFSRSLSRAGPGFGRGCEAGRERGLSHDPNFGREKPPHRAVAGVIARPRTSHFKCGRGAARAWTHPR